MSETLIQDNVQSEILEFEEIQPKRRRTTSHLTPPRPTQPFVGRITPSKEEAKAFHCLLNELTNVNVQERKTASQSVVLFADWRTRRIVLKLTKQSQPSDNSLEVERQLTMFIREKILPLSPHVVRGLAMGVCPPSAITPASNPFLPRSLLQQFHQLKPVTDLSSDVHFLITEYFDSLSVNQLIEKYPSEFIDNHWDLAIALQVAQFLSVLKRNRIRHNDLHMANTRIQVSDIPITFEYHYPFHYALKTNVSVKIIDFDLASGASWENVRLRHGFCKKWGICHEFIENFDWYVFLVLFCEAIRSHGMKSVAVERYLPMDITDYKFADIGQDAARGYPCECEAMDETTKKCAQCRVRLERLEVMKTCEDFIKENVK